MPRVITAATATRQGGRPSNADAVAVHYYDGADTTAAAVVDGIGHSREVVQVVGAAAQVMTRVAARTSPLAGIMAAAGMVTDPVYATPGPNAVAAVALCAPRRAVLVSHIGDCRAYSWNTDADTLTLHTEDHTIGQRMRVAGAEEIEARQYDNRVRSSLAIATVGTISETRVPVSDTLILLTSDGVHDALERDHLADLVRRHADDPDGLADALVTAAVETDLDEADNASAVVLLLSD